MHTLGTWHQDTAVLGCQQLATLNPKDQRQTNSRRHIPGRTMLKGSVHGITTPHLSPLHTPPGKYNIDTHANVSLHVHVSGCVYMRQVYTHGGCKGCVGVVWGCVGCGGFVGGCWGCGRGRVGSERSLLGLCGVYGGVWGDCLGVVWGCVQA